MNTAEANHRAPSSYIEGLTDYEAFCLDEAAAYIKARMQKEGLPSAWRRELSLGYDEKYRNVPKFLLDPKMRA